MSEELFQRAMAFSRKAHSNHIGYNGQPYFDDHIVHVVKNALLLIVRFPEGMISKDEEALICALAALHDCVEDEKHTGTTYADLEAAGFGDALISRVRRLDGRNRKGTYQQDIESMALEGDLAVITVKLADNQHNRSPERAATRPAHMDGIQKRYDRAGQVLEVAFAELLQTRRRLAS
jgi:(p)ppGpp synthase/HD superfamily hydrolase